MPLRWNKTARLFQPIARILRICHFAPKSLSRWLPSELCLQINASCCECNRHSIRSAATLRRTFSQYPQRSPPRHHRSTSNLSSIRSAAAYALLIFSIPQAHKWFRRGRTRIRTTYGIQARWPASPMNESLCLCERNDVGSPIFKRL